MGTRIMGLLEIIQILLNYLIKDNLRAYFKCSTHSPATSLLSYECVYGACTPEQQLSMFDSGMVAGHG